MLLMVPPEYATVEL